MKKLFFLFLFLCQAVWAVFCPYCGTENSDEFQFCHNCGESLSQVKNLRLQGTSRQGRQHMGGMEGLQGGRQNMGGLEGLQGILQNMGGMEGLQGGSQNMGGLEGLQGILQNMGGMEGLQGGLQNMLQSLMQNLPQQLQQLQQPSGKRGLSSGSTSDSNFGLNSSADYFSMSSPESFADSFQNFMGKDGVQSLLQLQNQDPSSFDLEQLNQDANISEIVNMIKNPAFQQQLMQGMKMIVPYSGSGQEMQEQMGQLQGLFQMLNQLNPDSYNMP